VFSLRADLQRGTERQCRERAGVCEELQELNQAKNAILPIKT